MVILPAIDIYNGQCVRLVKGDFATAHQVAEDPLSTAQQFLEDGAKWIHMVDLDGAKAGKPVNQHIINEIVSGLPEINIEVGGGIRSIDTIQMYLEMGVKRVILGSAAIKEPDLVKNAANLFNSRIAVGIDARNGRVATEGWIKEGDISYLELAKAVMEMGVDYIAYTDIDRDGTLTGPNIAHLEALNDLASSYGCKIIASGGISSTEDLVKCSEAGLYGCICGKAIYQGSVNLKEAIKIVGN